MKEYFPIGKFGGGKHESLSGIGSSLANTTTLRAELVRLFLDRKIDMIDDCPCGDFLWMNQTLLDCENSGLSIDYIGIDVQPDLIALNDGRHGGTQRQFNVGDVRDFDFRNGSLIVIRDCFIHLSNADVQLALENLQRKCPDSLILSTTYPGRSKNENISTGRFRPINLEKKPFSLSKPERYINENYPSTQFWDKSLGLWRVKKMR